MLESAGEEDTAAGTEEGLRHVPVYGGDHVTLGMCLDSEDCIHFTVFKC